MGRSHFDLEQLFARKIGTAEALTTRDSESIPVYHANPTRRGRLNRNPWQILVLGLFAFVTLGTYTQLFTYPTWSHSTQIPLHSREILAKCAHLKLMPGPPVDFNKRIVSDRFVNGTKPVLLKNATIWTGRLKGLEILKGDVVLKDGLIRSVGVIDPSSLEDFAGDLVVVDLKGSWVTPGIVDLHSHIGVDSVPELSGANDGNSLKGVTQPWLRSLDGLNTHDDAYKLSIAGGVTTALILPGSANAIGGQAFVIKLRDTTERSPTSKLLEPPYSIVNGTNVDLSIPPRWRQMKHACGENPSRVYGNTRMDNVWAWRQIYDKARKIKEDQDEYCEKASNNLWEGLGAFPEDLQYEAAVDTLRGRVKVQMHCYEAVDLDDAVRLTHEFKFPIAAFHHAHETYLVPDLLKSSYGHPPAISLFATQARYKREAFRGSEFAPRILADNGLNVVMKSDHPVLNSRYLLYEAQQAHYYGLHSNLALAAVTSTPAEVMGMEHRIGFIKEGYDADLVVWDSHPLMLGAAPQQVYIDGIAQLASPYVVKKPSFFQELPRTPNFDKEVNKTIEYDGVPPLMPRGKSGAVLFKNVKEVMLRKTGDIHVAFTADTNRMGVVLVEDGAIQCFGMEPACVSFMTNLDVETIDLKGGSVSPSLVSYGSPLGLEEIHQEASTKDGYVFDPLIGELPSIMRGSVIRAVDGLQFQTREALLAYRSGVATGITAPTSAAFTSGLSTAFRLGAAHKLAEGAVVQSVAALHVSINHIGVPSVSTQIATLRRLLLRRQNDENSYWFGKAANGEIPLAVHTSNADIISSLLLLKKEVDEHTGEMLKLTIVGASEAHLLAKELGEAGVGVILIPVRPFPKEWDAKRILPGPPLTKESAISHLVHYNVTVGLGIEEIYEARNTRFDVGWALFEADRSISPRQAIAMASTNLENLLGVDIDESFSDLVVTMHGGLLDIESKVVGVISQSRKIVDLF